MEDLDGFEFVDCDCNGFGDDDEPIQVHFEDDEPRVSGAGRVAAAAVHEPEPGAVGDGEGVEHEPGSIFKEILEIKRLREHLQSQSNETMKLIKTLREQRATDNVLRSQLTKELEALHHLRASLLDQQSQFAAQRQKMSQILESLSSASSDNMKEGGGYQGPSALLQAELSRLKSLCAEQREMILVQELDACLGSDI